MDDKVAAFMRKLEAQEKIRKKLYDSFCDDVAEACTMPFDYLVTIHVDDHFITEYLEYDGNINQFIWLNDWYEGQTYVEFVGCVPVRDLRVNWSGENVIVEVRHHEV